jgi:hypothetical protein
MKFVPRLFSKKAFVCPQCGRTHEGQRRDVAFALPDAVWALEAEERQRHLDWSTDICYFESTWFIRGILNVPLDFEDSALCWGVWASVEEPVITAYKQVFSSDGSSCPPEIGFLANSIPGYPETTGLALKIQFGTSTQRPIFTVDPSVDHLLGQEQRDGISCTRVSELLAPFGG